MTRAVQAETYENDVIFSTEIGLTSKGDVFAWTSLTIAKWDLTSVRVCVCGGNQDFQGGGDFRGDFSMGPREFDFYFSFFTPSIGRQNTSA